MITSTVAVPFSTFAGYSLPSTTTITSPVALSETLTVIGVLLPSFSPTSTVISGKTLNVFDATLALYLSSPR